MNRFSVLVWCIHIAIAPDRINDYLSSSTTSSFNPRSATRSADRREALMPNFLAANTNICMRFASSVPAPLQAQKCGLKSELYGTYWSQINLVDDFRLFLRPCHERERRYRLRCSTITPMTMRWSVSLRSVGKSSFKGVSSNTTLPPASIPRGRYFLNVA